MKAQVYSDIVVSLVKGPFDGVPVPNELIGTPPPRLRFDGASIVSVDDYSSWAIDPEDPKQTKRLPLMADPDWPVIDCAFDDAIIKDGETWRAETDADRLEAVKADARRRAIARADAFTAPILSAYPEAERAGWDKREAEARAIKAADEGGGDIAAAIASTLIVKALADRRGFTDAETVVHAETIIAKAETFAAISAAVEVMRDTALTAIDAVTDPANMLDVLTHLETQAASLAAEYGLD